LIWRLWRTGLKPNRSQAYEEFARKVSLPMLRQQKGFLGCVMSRDADEGLVLTFWPDIDAVAALDESQSYQATVARILEADLMAGTQSTETKEIHLIEIPGMA